MLSALQGSISPLCTVSNLVYSFQYFGPPGFSGQLGQAECSRAGGRNHGNAECQMTDEVVVTVRLGRPVCRVSASQSMYAEVPIGIIPDLHFSVPDEDTVTSR